MSPISLSADSAMVVDLVVGVLVRGSVILLAALIVTRLLRDSSAAARHAVWSLTTCGLLLAPLVDAAIPSWKVEGLYVGLQERHASVGSEAGVPRSEAPAFGRAAVQPARTRSKESASPVGDPSVATAGSPGNGPWRVPLDGLVLMLWGGGALLLLARLGLDALRARAIAGRAEAVSTGVLRMAVPLAYGVGVRRRIKILVSDEVSVPLSWGWLFPVIVLPAGAADWTTDRKRAVLLHELYHVKRYDYAFHLLTEVACALYWPNPLVWIAARSAATECERACDDHALEAGLRSDEYAGHLIDIARLQVGAALPRGAFAMARRSSLATRVRSILNGELERRPMSRIVLIAVGLAGLAFVLPTASIDLWGFVEPGREMVQNALQGGDAVSRRIGELDDQHPLVRRHAAWVLGELESERGVLPLVDRLVDRDADVRLVSAWALGEIKSRVAIDPLIELLDDEEPLVREMAALSLGEIEHESTIEPLLNGLEHDHELLDPVIWALGEIGGSGRSVRAALIRESGRRLWENDEVWTGNVGTREASGMRGSLTELLDALGSSDATLRCSAAEWLGRLGDERAVEPLLDTLRDRNPAVRAMAIWALDEINPSRRANR